MVVNDISLFVTKGQNTSMHGFYIELQIHMYRNCMMEIAFDQPEIHNNLYEETYFSFSCRARRPMEVGHPGAIGQIAAPPVGRVHSQGQGHARTPPLRMEDQTVLGIAQRRLIAT